MLTLLSVCALYARLVFEEEKAGSVELCGLCSGQHHPERHFHVLATEQATAAGHVVCAEASECCRLHATAARQRWR